MLAVINLAAKGDLTQKVSVSGTDSMGLMGNSLSLFFNQLISNIRSISNTAAKLAGSVQEIDKEVKDQVAVSAQQASSVSEIFTTAEKLVDASGQMAEQANSVAKISTSVLDESQSGMEAMATLKR